jgi:O-antigen/teichoic acid export membrane protein
LTDVRPAVHVARGAFFLFIQSLVTGIVGAVGFGIIARLMTRTEMGVYVTLNLVFALVQIGASFALPNAAVKFIAELRGQNDRKGAAGVAFQILRFTLVASIISGSLAFFFSTQICYLLTKTTGYVEVFKILALDLVFAGVLPSLNGIMVGLQKMRELAGLNIVAYTISKVLSIAFLLANLGLWGVVLGSLIGDLSGFLLFSGYMLKSFGMPSFSFSLRRILGFSWPIYLSSWVGFGYNWFDRALLLAYVPLADVGVYNVAVTAFGVMASIPSAISTALFPRYSELQGRDGMYSMEKAVRTASRYVSYVVVPLAVGLAAAASPAISLFAGRAYEMGALPLAILSLFGAATCVGAALSDIFSIAERTKVSALLTFIGVSISVFLGFLLVPSTGALGAAILRGVAMVLGLALMLAVLKRMRLFAVGFDFEALWKSWVASSVMAVAVLGFQFILYNKYLLPLYILAGGVVYLVLLRFLKAVRAYDVHLVSAFVGGRWAPLIEWAGARLIS